MNGRYNDAILLLTDQQLLLLALFGTIVTFALIVIPFRCIGSHHNGALPVSLHSHLLTTFEHTITLLLLASIWSVGLFYIRNPLSVETKLCIVTGYIPAHIRKMEWTFIPQKLGTQQRRLIVAFAGGGVRIGGYSLTEFANTSSKVSDCDVLLLTDPLQLWYLSNYSDLHKRLQEFVKDYETVMFLGNCLGGSGALLFADLATVVLTFGPQTSLVHAKGLYWLNGWRLPSQHRLNFTEIIDKVDLCRGKCFAYFSPIKGKDNKLEFWVAIIFDHIFILKHLDSYMATYASPKICTSIIEECTSETVPQWLKQRSRRLVGDDDSSPNSNTKSDDLVVFIEQHFAMGCSR